MKWLLLSLASVGLMGFQTAQAQGPKSPKPATKQIYRDSSWTHIGNGNFSAQSDGASDLTVKSAGESMSFRLTFKPDLLKEIANPRWKSVEFQGEVIGNDTGKFGNCTATVVKLNGQQIGEIRMSGNFRIAFEKSLLLKTPQKPLTMLILSGNASGDTDDQELGQFVLMLSERPAPIPKPAIAEKLPALK